MDFQVKDDFLLTGQCTKPLQMELPKTPVVTSLDQRMASFGSCFAQNMQAVLRPFGFHFWFNRPICSHYTSRSIRDAVRMLAENKEHTSQELKYWNESKTDVHAPFYFKLRYYGSDAEARIFAEMKRIDEEARVELRWADIVVLTLGNTTYWDWPEPKHCISAFFELSPKNYPRFEQSHQDVTSDLEETYSMLCHRFGRTKKPIVFVTVSPQRYLYTQHDGLLPPLMYNSLMKATLVVGAHQFIKNHSNESVFYFPAFEMVMEELRLYETLSTYDFTHINQEMTPRYVIKRFLKTYCSDDLQKLLPIIEAFQQLMNLSQKMLNMGIYAYSETLVMQWETFLKKAQEPLSRIECCSIVNSCVTTLLQLKRPDLIAKYLVTARTDSEFRRTISACLTV